MAEVESVDSLPDVEEPSSAPGGRAFFAVLALLLFRWAVYGQVSMTTTKELNARAELQRLLERSQAALRENRYDDAVAPLDELTRIQPKNHVYWWQKATVLGALARRREEIDALEGYVKVAPLPGEACPRLGFAYLDLGMNAESLDAFRRCAAFSPTDLNDAFFLGHALERNQRVDEAYEVYAKARQPGASGDLEAGLGRMLLRKGQPAAALKAVQPTLAKNANHYDALLVAGIAQTRLGKYKEARELLERGSKRKSDTDFELALGMVDDLTGKRADAIAHYEASLRFDPENKDAIARLARLVPKKQIDALLAGDGGSAPVKE